MPDQTPPPARADQANQARLQQQQGPPQGEPTPQQQQNAGAAHTHGSPQGAPPPPRQGTPPPKPAQRVEPPPPRPKKSGGENFKRSETLTAFAPAFAKAQAAMETASKDKDNPFFHSKYADMASVVGAIRPAFAPNGLFFMQFPRSNDEGIEIETLIMHESGEWISDILAFPTMRIDPHGYGQAITYCRRYALQAMCGVAPEEDDGNAPTDAIKATREAAIKKLEAAAAIGMEAFEEAFKDVPMEVRKVIQRDLPGIRAKIAGQPPPKRAAV